MEPHRGLSRSAPVALRRAKGDKSVAAESVRGEKGRVRISFRRPDFSVVSLTVAGAWNRLSWGRLCREGVFKG